MLDFLSCVNDRWAKVMRSWSLPFFIHRGRTKFLVPPVIAAVFVTIWSEAALTGCSLAFTWQAWCFVWLFVVPIGIYGIVLSVWPSPVFALYEDRVVYSSVFLPMKHTIIARSDIVLVKLHWQDDGCSPSTLILTVLDAGLPPAAKKSKSSEIKINVDQLEFEPRICFQILQAYVAGRKSSI